MGKRKSHLDAGAPTNEVPKDKKHKKGKASKSGPAEESKSAPSGFDADLAGIFASAVASAPAPAPTPTPAPAPAPASTPAPAPAPAPASPAAAPSESGENAAPSDAEGNAQGSDDEELDEAQLAALREELGVPEGAVLNDEPEPAVKSKKRGPLTLEERAEQDRRTVFVGNVPLGALSSRVTQRRLRVHLVSLLPGLPRHAIESVRFRSVPFATPTDGRGGDDQKRSDRTRQHRQDMARRDLEEQGLNPLSVTYLRPSQKRKIAAIKAEVNSLGSSCNCYVVLDRDVGGMKPESAPGLDLDDDDEEDEDDDDDDANDVRTNQKRGKDVGEERTPALDAQRAGEVRAVTLGLCALLDGTPFEGKHLRSDLTVAVTPEEIASVKELVQHSKAPLLQSMSNLLRAAVSQLEPGQAPHETVFIGNLDFQASEEDLRAFIEATLVQERGPAPTRWVKSVRIVRDRATQLGKGFAYVRLADEACVDELMALHEADLERARIAEIAHRKAGASEGGRSRPTVKRTLKFMKRALRVSRCKTAPPKPKATKSPRDKDVSPPTPKGMRRRSTGAPTPGGSSPWSRPPLRTLDGSPTRAPATASEKPSHDTPEDPAKAAAKLAKKQDAERQAKRLAKKQKKRMDRAVEAATGSASGKIKLQQGRRSKASKPGHGKAPRKPTKPKK